mmetsp:Transcript_63694/g.111142  ORF Transcript_63694/g.111142 Transcript_63694/m.111142 type:complete len:81 (+) Transcript_63694:165-407(+)
MCTLLRDYSTSEKVKAVGSFKYFCNLNRSQLEQLWRVPVRSPLLLLPLCKPRHLGRSAAYLPGLLLGPMVLPCMAAHMMH